MSPSTRSAALLHGVRHEADGPGHARRLQLLVSQMQGRPRAGSQQRVTVMMAGSGWTFREMSVSRPLTDAGRSRTRSPGPSGPSSLLSLSRSVMILRAASRVRSIASDACSRAPHLLGVLRDGQTLNHVVVDLEGLLLT